MNAANETINQVDQTNSKDLPVTYSVTTAEIAKLKEKYATVPTDLSVKANYEICRKASSELRGLRGDVEKKRKELKADALAWGKKVDSAAKDITEKLLAIETPHAEAKKDYDNKVEIDNREKALAEERRVDGIAERIATIKALPMTAISLGSLEIVQMIDDLTLNQFYPVAEWAMEFADKATMTIQETAAKLDELSIMKLQQEQAAEILAEQQRQQAIQEQQRKLEEEEARIQREDELLIEKQQLAEARYEIEKAQKQAELLQEQERQQLEQERRAIREQQEQREREFRAQQEAQEKEKAAIALQQAELLAQQERDRLALIEKHEAEKTPTTQPTTQTTNQSTTTAATTTITDDYRTAGNAMLVIIGHKDTTKALLDAIISGNIPNITYTGA